MLFCACCASIVRNARSCKLVVTNPYNTSSLSTKQIVGGAAISKRRGGIRSPAEAKARGPQTLIQTRDTPNCGVIQHFKSVVLAASSNDAVYLFTCIPRCFFFFFVRHVVCIRLSCTSPSCSSPALAGCCSRSCSSSTASRGPTCGPPRGPTPSCPSRSRTSSRYVYVRVCRGFYLRCVKGGKGIVRSL